MRTAEGSTVMTGDFLQNIWLAVVSPATSVPLQTCVHSPGYSVAPRLYGIQYVQHGLLLLNIMYKVTGGSIKAKKKTKKTQKCTQGPSEEALRLPLASPVPE